ncbi:AzlD domain-containing protein [Austwickia chelonae]|uniref:AzlD domain-containing protein n=1 Tax=Austwickia chelonae TaxID=100225 RepID=UPI000E24EBEA|nr:AzlD domain-containing protein [Austwickia chelonae]
MTPWLWLGLACLIAFATKLLGYLVPESVLDAPILRQASAACTVGLLSALVVANTFTTGQNITFDARIAALAAAAVALILRAPFIVVVLVGMIAAALARLF